MSVPDHQLDPPIGDDCFDCLVDQHGHKLACEIVESEGGYDSVCPHHRFENQSGRRQE